MAYFQESQGTTEAGFSPVLPNPDRELTFGEKAVGLDFNPGGLPEVYRIKSLCADAINYLNDLRAATDNGEIKRQLSVAITEIQTAQMWAVKAVTWKY